MAFPKNQNTNGNGMSSVYVDGNRKVAIFYNGKTYGD